MRAQTGSSGAVVSCIGGDGGRTPPLSLSENPPLPSLSVSLSLLPASSSLHLSPTLSLFFSISSSFLSFSTPSLFFSIFLFSRSSLRFLLSFSHIIYFSHFSLFSRRKLFPSREILLSFFLPLFHGFFLPNSFLLSFSFTLFSPSLPHTCVHTWGRGGGRFLPPYSLSLAWRKSFSSHASLFFFSLSSPLPLFLLLATSPFSPSSSSFFRFFSLSSHLISLDVRRAYPLSRRISFLPLSLFLSPPFLLLSLP